MDFKNVKTYGRFKHRVIQTDLWISPQVQRNRLFASTSSESSINSSSNSSVNRSEQDSAVSVGVERASESLSSEKISSPTESISSEEKSSKSLSNGSNGKDSSQLSSLEKNNNSPVLMGHSTPYSSHSRVAVRPRRLPVISPLVITESPLEGNEGQFDSPNLFSDTSQEHCESSANRNESRCSTANQDEAKCSTANQKGDSCNATNEKGDSCNIDWTNELAEKDLSLKSEISNSSTRTSLELEIKLQKLSSDDIQNISDKIKHLSLNEDSTGNNSKFSHSDIANRSEYKIIEDTCNCCEMQDSSVENRSSSGHDICNNVDSFSHENRPKSHKVVSNGVHGHSDLNGCPCNHSISNGMERSPRECKCMHSIDNSGVRRDLSTRDHAQSLEKVSDVTGENNGSTNHSNNLKQIRQAQNISNSVQCVFTKKDSTTLPNGHISETNHISYKDRSNVLQDECQQDDANPTTLHEASNNTKPVHSGNQVTNMNEMSKKLGGLRLLDAKVYLNKKEGLRSSSSGNVKNQSDKTTPKNSMDCVNVSPSGDAHPPTHSGNGLAPFPFSDVHPPVNSGNILPPLPSVDVYPPLHSGDNLPPLTSNEVHQPLPSGNVPPQHIPGSLKLSRNGCTDEVTPNNSDVHTPVTGQRTGKIVKNANYSSFVDALTPARFQQRKRPLSPKEKILMQCEQQKPLKFSEVLSSSVLAKCVKVGEGTYGEVYKTNDGVEDVALKVIPVEGNFTVNDEPQKSFEEMIPEIVISKELSNLGDCDDVCNAVHICSNFIKVKRVMLVQDSYPRKLLQEWDSWKNNHNCENERPDMYQSDQYFVVFEFIDGGEDMERFEFKSMDEALSVLQQVALSLSVAEESLMFEHRDLHWGNVLIKRTKCKTIRYKLCGEDLYVKSAGIFVSIIDFTLSRLTKDGVTVFCDLSKDPDIFKGKGDYQFQVYRLMKKANNNNWESHKPYSNVLWIRYLIDKVLNAKKYKKENSIQRNIRTYLRQVLSFESALQAVKDGFLGIEVNTGL